MDTKPFYQLLAPPRYPGSILEDRIDQDLEEGSLTYETVQIDHQREAFVRSESNKMCYIISIMAVSFVIVGMGFLLILYLANFKF